MKKLGLAFLLTCSATIAEAQALPPPTGNGSVMVTSTVTPVFSAAASRTYLLLFDASDYGSGASAPVDIWCTDIAGVTPAVNGVGSFDLLAFGGHREFNTTSLGFSGRTYVPPGPVSCVTAAGSTAALTAEAN